MNVIYTKESADSKSFHKNRVHHVLAHSYLFYFVLFLFALLVNFVFPVKLFSSFNGSYFSMSPLILGTLIILWAQMSSHKLQKENMTIETFLGGPYRYTRIPTHLGLFLLMVGLGLAVNSLFIFLFAFVFLVITKLTFIRKEENILTEKYGEPYLEYKKIVKF